MFSRCAVNSCFSYHYFILDFPRRGNIWTCGSQWYFLILCILDVYVSNYGAKQLWIFIKYLFEMDPAIASLSNFDGFVVFMLWQTDRKYTLIYPNRNKRFLLCHDIISKFALYIFWKYPGQQSAVRGSNKQQRSNLYIFYHCPYNWKYARRRSVHLHMYFVTPPWAHEYPIYMNIDMIRATIHDMPMRRSMYLWCFNLSCTPLIIPDTSPIHCADILSFSITAMADLMDDVLNMVSSCISV